MEQDLSQEVARPSASYGGPLFVKGTVSTAAVTDAIECVLRI